MSGREKDKAERRSIPEISIDAKMLYNRIVKLEVGQQISYEELTNLVGRDVQGDGYSLLKTAREKAEREDHKCFCVIPTVGIKRMGDREIVASGEGYIARIRKAARRGARRVSNVANFAALPKEEQLKHNVQLSFLGAVDQFSGSASIKRITGKVEGTQGVLPSATALRASFE